MIITETGRGYEIHFDYRPTIVAELKTIPGVRFQGKTRGWFVPISTKVNEETVFNRPAMEKFKKKYLKTAPGADAAEQFFKEVELPELTIEIAFRQGFVPFNYQSKGIARGLELERFINGDQPGLGKTSQSIGTLLGFEKMRKSVFPCLVICKNTLKENWRREIEEIVSTKRAVILSNKNRDIWHSLVQMNSAHFIIINYESLWSYFALGRTDKKKTGIPKLNEILFDPRKDLFKSVIIDELHNFKSADTKQTKMARGLTMGKDIIIGLTGTPVVNKPKDLASQLAIINQLHLFGGWKFFMDRYCQGGSGAANLQELNGKLNKYCFFRREKKDVLSDLPDKCREIITCDITTREEYNLAKNDLKKYLEQSGYTSSQIDKSMNGEIMVRIGKLKAISARGKLPEAFEHIQEVVDAGEKIVVFIHQKFMAEALLKQFPGFVSVRGQEIGEDGKERPQSATSRQSAVDKFQNDPDCLGIVVSITAGGVGITLTAASRLIMLELPWHAAHTEQCEDRIHRIGQKNAAQISYFLGKGTIDEDIYKLIEEKRKVSDAITGTTTDISTIITDLTKNLFNQR